MISSNHTILINEEYITFTNLVGKDFQNRRLIYERPLAHGGVETCILNPVRTYANFQAPPAANEVIQTQTLFQ